jgi:hypothetical protein
MNDGLHFDPVDEELGRRLRDQGPLAGDPDVVLDAMRPRLRGARARRRAAMGGALASAAAAVILVLVVASGGSGGTGSVRTPPASRGPVRTLPTVTTTAPDGTPGDGRAATGVDGGEASKPDDHGATADTQPVSGPGAEVPEATPPTSTPAAADTPYMSDGGSIVVRFDGSQVSLVSSSPATGFTAEVHDNGPTRVEVRFSNGETEWRIRVDVVNGGLVPEITQH